MGRGRPVIGADKAPKTAPSATTGATPSAEVAGGEDRHDANDLARAAIERLRSGSASAHPSEVARLPEAPRSEPKQADPARAEVAPSTTAVVQPLPPPVVVSAPGNEASTASIGGAPYAAAGGADPARPTPPADIPSHPLELHAEAATAAAQDRGNVADNMLAAAKSVFHAVLPK
jgi:hypothetical protein